MMLKRLAAGFCAVDRASEQAGLPRRHDTTDLQNNDSDEINHAAVRAAA